MTSLFNEEDTVAIRRTDSASQIPPEGTTLSLDLSGTHKLLDNLAIYDNPLLNASSELLALLVSLSRQGSPLDIDDFRQKLLDSIADFKRRGLFLDYHPNVIEKSCFVLCAAFDEKILYTEWGAKSRWENHSLLSKVFNQRDGGEVFFNLLDQACRQPAKLVDFLELQYILIMLGFLGKYQNFERNKINELQSELYRIIVHYRDRSTLIVPKMSTLSKIYIPWSFLSTAKLLSIGVVIILCSYLFSEYWYENRREPTLQAFNSLDMNAFVRSNKSDDLIYVSTDEDLGLIKQDKQPAEKIVTLPNIEWEVTLASFSELSDARRLAKELSAAGYIVEIREIIDGVELVIPKQMDIGKAKSLKNELNVRFGLDATVRQNRQSQ